MGKKKNKCIRFTHTQLVNIIKDTLESNEEKIVSPKMWIQGPTIPDIVSYSVPSNMSRPLLKIIEVKANDKTDLQRALYQLIAARESMMKKQKGMYALFSVAISQYLYDELIRTDELDIFLNIMDCPLSELLISDSTGKQRKQERSTLGFGVILINEKSEIKNLLDPRPFGV